MIVRFRRGNMTETRPVHGKLDHHVSAGRKRDGYKQLPVSVEFTKYGNTLFRPVIFGEGGKEERKIRRIKVLGGRCIVLIFFLFLKFPL